MPTLSIIRLSNTMTKEAQAGRPPDEDIPFAEVLNRIYFDSGFLDPIEDIVNALRHSANALPPVPFGVFRNGPAIGLLVIGRSGPFDRLNRLFDRLCWLESFLIAKEYQGKGYGGEVLQELPEILKRVFPSIRRLCLTVNFRNQKAKRLYRKGGSQTPAKRIGVVRPGRSMS